jgi:hypothetical protein
MCNLGVVIVNDDAAYADTTIRRWRSEGVQTTDFVEERPCRTGVACGGIGCQRGKVGLSAL